MQPEYAAPTAIPKRTPLPLPALALLGLAVILCALWFVHARGYWEDDAWIHLEFARSLSRGRGFEFNGHLVYGDTSALWVWLLLGLHALIPDWIGAGKVLSAASVIFSLGGAFVYARSLVAGNARPLRPAASSVFAAGAVLLVVTNPYFGYWAFSGMEALAAMGLVCWAGAAAGPLQITPRRLLLGALAAGLAPLLRPEMAFFTILLGLVLLHRWIIMQGDPPLRLALLGGSVALALGPGLVWASYAFHTFGSVLPTTNAAKRAAPGDSVLMRLLDVYALGFPLVLAGLLVFGGYWLWQYRVAKRPQNHPVHRPGNGPRNNSAPQHTEDLTGLLHAGGWIVFFWTALNCLFYVVDHTFVQTRYVFVTAPVLTIALLALIVKLMPRLAAAGLALGCLVGLLISGLATWPLIGNKVRLDRDYADLALFLRSLPPNASVAHYSIGEAAFLSEHPLVDTGGITRPGVIPYLWDTSESRLVGWVHHEGARYWVINHQPEPGATLVWRRSIPSTGWYLNPRRYATQDLLEVWRLPAVPTAPPGVPTPPELP